MSERFERTLPLGAPLPGSSFVDLLSSVGATPRWDIPAGVAGTIQAPEGTTVLALRYAGGVVMAGDRRATEGHLVAHRHLQKVFQADRHSTVAIAGTAGLAIEMVRLFQVELEHYEKIEGTRLTLEGKANFLARLVRNQLPMAFQGLVVVPLFAGYDPRRRIGRLWKYDVTGGRYEETEYDASGSGGLYARESVKKAFRPGLSREDALRIAVQALADAADEDRATGGVDLARGIFPLVCVCTAAGVEEVDRETLERVYRDQVIAPRVHAEA